MSSQRSIRVSYADTVFGPAERRAVMRVLRDPSKIVAGPAVRAFEGRIASVFGKKTGVMVNSGSSANLIALSVLGIPEGAEVITPALTFSTTLAPILQRRLKPVFVDVEEGTYVVDVDQVASRFTPRTKALVIPSLIGNIPDMQQLRALARRHHLRFLEDSCDTLGARFRGKPTGYYSDVSTTSFYASHIITAAGGGGMVCFHDPALAERSRVMSYWGRQSTLFGAYEKSEEFERRFAGVLDGEPYDAKFIFTEVGFNVQPLELQAAFGLEQLKRFPLFAKRRKENFKRLLAFFRRYEEFFILPRMHPDADTAWLAFALTTRKEAPFTRMELVRFLEAKNIQTRPIFTGNVLRQPAFRDVLKDLPNHFPVTDTVMRGGLLIGCHHGMGVRHLSFLERSFQEFLGKY